MGSKNALVSITTIFIDNAIVKIIKLKNSCESPAFYIFSFISPQKYKNAVGFLINKKSFCPPVNPIVFQRNSNTFLV